MRCVNCDGELIPGKRFCPSCGSEVVHRCPSCNATVEPSFRFCPECGTRLAPADASPAAPAAEPRIGDRLERLARHMPPSLAEKIRTTGQAPTEERKLVTVFFCDLVGSTAIAEGLDPEEYRELLDRYMELVFREIYAREGVVNQLAGDGLMALFGAPIAHEDAPERAVEAALAIRDALAEFNRTQAADRQLQVRIGIHSGPVVVGTVGNDLKMDYTAIGDTTNLAARLQSLARPGTILVSEATNRMLRGSFEVQQVGPLEVKGKRERVAAYEILGPGEAVTPMARAEARGLTPFVGRQAELTQLLSCYQRLGENLGQVLAVVGDAGSGKSRLIYEFKQQLGGQPVTFLEGRCSSLSQGVPYAPLITMLRQHFELDAGESAEWACGKITARLGELKGDSGKLYGPLCHLLSISGDGGTRADGVATDTLSAEELKQLTFDAVANLVYRLSQRTPVVMILEDLHWVDDATREMIELAVTRVRAAPMMLLVSHRPDYLSTWRATAAFTQLNLRPLGAADASAIVSAVASGRMPPALEARVLAKGEGNPFFLEEITRALVEEGYLLRGDGHIRLTRPVAEIGIPDTVQELISARLDRLRASTKRVAQVASVLGRQFRRAHLARLLDSEGIDVAAELQTLEERGLIHRKNVLSRDEYRFGESLAQEVAYETLLLRERRQLHERIGLFLEALPGEPDAERAALVAHHLTHSDNREKAIEALLRAADAAERLPSYSAAVNLFRQAWEAADAAFVAAGGADERLARWVVQATLGLARVAVLYGPAHLADAERAARRGRDLAQKLGPVEALAGLNMFHGLLMMNDTRERFAEGLALAEDALAIAHRANLDLLATSMSRGLAWSYLLDGQSVLARRTIEWVVGDLEQRGHREPGSDMYFGARWILGGVLYHSDDLAAALATAGETYELSLKAGNRTAQSGSSATLAEVYFERAEYRQALTWAERSLEISRAISSVAGIRTAAAIVLAARVELGETGNTAPYLESIEEGLAAGGNLPLNSRLVIDAMLAVGEVERARRIAEVGASRGGGRLREVIVTAGLGDVMARLGPAHWSEADRWYAQALGLAQTIGARSTAMAALLGMADLAAARGEREQAARQARQALALAEELGFHRARARAERALAELSAGLQQLA